MSLERRIEILEENMGQLREVPARLSAVESQFVQLRIEMRAGFSALRSEMRELNNETKAQMRVLHEEVISRLALLQEGRPASSRKSQRKRKTR